MNKNSVGIFAIVTNMGLLSLLLPQSASGAEFYVAPNGKDTNAGTIALPFETPQRAQEAAHPGDTVYLRGGVYAVREDQIARRQGNYAYVFEMNKSGEPEKPIKYWAYQTETPVFDFSQVKAEGLRIVAFYVSGSRIHFKGFGVKGVQVTIKTHTQSECFENQGSNNIYERLSMHDGQAIGFYLLNGSNNLVLNCDAYRNHDFTSENGRGGNTDGFGAHPRKGATGNVFRGCRAWFNSDDGYDCINSAEAVTFENCWAFYNGFSDAFKSLGDGNGFKGGGYGSTPVGRLPTPIPRHVIRFCLAVRNKANGFYANHHIGGGDWFNNTAYRNPTNFNMLERLADNVTDVPGTDQKMKNNLGYKGGKEVANLTAEKSDVTGNYFNLPVQVADNDFLSLEEKELIEPRQPDGSLPKISFLHPAKGSDLIDKGADVGFPFKGAKPDLGCFESGY
ncbi:MAG: hypothetical protein QOD99_2431 [Chthoniobacter sp.]|jgi:hypothetical protein|nr:hypothetical protein [Chthoniobacter sp.]